MGDIYRTANKVIIWLGDEDEHTEDVRLHLLPELLACCEKSKLEDEVGDPQPLVIENLGMLYLNSPNWHSFRNISHRPYFRRMWIVQEVVLGVECIVLIGSQEFRWNDIAEASFCLRRDTQRAVEAHGCASLIRRLKKTSSSHRGKSFLNLLGHSYQLLCTNPLDKVFGLLGISSDIQPEELAPDYSLTCQQVFSMAARLVISKDKSVSLLCYVKFPKTVQGLPSWVPDWTAVSPVREILGLRKENYALLHTEMPRSHVSADGLLLHTRTSRVDSVQCLGDLMPSDTLATYWAPNAPYLQVIKDWERLSLSAMPYCTGEAYMIVFWRALTADGNTRGKSSDQHREDLFKTWYKGFLENGFIKEQPFGLEHWIPPHPSLHSERGLEFWALFSGASEGRQMVTTTKGFLGLVPADAREGDCSFFFSDVSVPILLRPMSSEGGYILIGESYLQGWMSGSQAGIIKHEIQDIVIR